MNTLQKFASVHANVNNHYILKRHLIDRQNYKERRSAALADWRLDMACADAVPDLPC
jgi:putative transposase